MLTDRQIGQWLLAIQEEQAERLRALTTEDVRTERSHEFWRKSLERAAKVADDPIEIFDYLLALAVQSPYPGRHDLNRLLVLASAAGNTRCAQRLIDRRAFVFSSNARKQNCLMLAAHGGHLDVARALVEAGSAVDMVDARGNTALYYAVDGLHEGVIAYLRHLGADPNRQNGSGESPMSLADGLPEIQSLLHAKGGPDWHTQRARPCLFHYSKAFGLGFDPSRLDQPVLYGGDYNGMMPAYPGVPAWSWRELAQYDLGWFMAFIGRLRRHENFSLEELLDAAERNGTPAYYRDDVG